MGDNVLKCHVCDGPISPGHRAHRGVLTNGIAYLRSRLASDKEMLATLEKKDVKRLRPGDEAARFMAALLNVQAQVIRGTELLAELERIEGECYGSGHQPPR